MNTGICTTKAGITGYFRNSQRMMSLLFLSLLMLGSRNSIITREPQTTNPHSTSTYHLSGSQWPLWIAVNEESFSILLARTECRRPIYSNMSTKPYARDLPAIQLSDVPPLFSMSEEFALSFKGSISMLPM